ncbi:MAG: MarR family transcriptional regulator [Ruminococcus sp.]|nr:MarR family transcriptional regulator [Ruminococcus sp.]
MSRQTTTALFKVFPLLRRAIFEAFDKQDTKLTRTQQIILVTMAGSDSLSMSELARSINTSNEQATRAISQLVDIGFVTRSQNEQNHRIVNIDLTEKAEKYIADVEYDAENMLYKYVGKEKTKKTMTSLTNISKCLTEE